jgi:two-component system, NarL family, response regulator NreC
MSTPSRVLLADDHSIVRHAVRTILESSKNYTVVGEAENSEQIVKLLEELRPDLLILDLGLPGKSGLETIFEVRQKQLPVKIVVLTMYEEENKVIQTIAAGASAFLLKSTTPSEFIDALDKVSGGVIYLPRRFDYLRETINNHSQQEEGSIGGGSDPLSKLSQREREVFYMLAEGLPNRTIAKKLFISARTVETHRARVIKKLGFNSTADLIRYALRNNLRSL